MDRGPWSRLPQRMQRTLKKQLPFGRRLSLRLRAALSLGWGAVGVLAKSGPGKVLTALAEGPHSQIAKDPERRWTQDL